MSLAGGLSCDGCWNVLVQVRKRIGAARVVETTSRIRLAFAAACPEADLIRCLPGALLPLGP